ncbi:outer membrane receptor for ferrienterochelin and colicins [Marinomonas alcarazii]|uniref:Outer membrane receptor for ferrienterochelin and colicins n=1 Tax=Marinomonas alcarazii TaxID=491949 RepID=A0A318UWN4_9GAMM|nr:TonB-dependent receptor [Marinomonas alcarazii]PYF80926.1 outer membrane receptor for ferrienterochelin and colicins [Marinomonas alcarazii]
MTPSARNYRLTTLAALISATTYSTTLLAEENTVNLDQLVVSASGSEVDIKDAPASISVITREDIERTPVTSISELLADLPGVTGGYTTAGAGSKITFRGMPDKYTLIMVDGRRVGGSSLTGYRPDLVGQDIDWISPDMIERIEIIRGPMSTLYGSEAMGGVINIITKKVPAQWKGTLSANYQKPDSGSYGDTKQLGATIAGPISEKVGIKLGLNKTDSEADTNPRGSSGLDNRSVNSEIDWQINKNHKVTLNLNYGLQKSESAPNAEYEQFRAGELEHKGYGVGYEGYIGNVKNTVNLYHNQYNNNDQSVPNGRGGYTTGDSEANETVLDAKTNIPLTFGVDQDVTIGLQYKEEDIYNRAVIGNLSADKDGNTIDPDLNPDGWSGSLFAENQLYLQDNLILTLGARFDKTDGFDAHLSPRAYLVYHPNLDWTIKGGISQGFRAPTLKERSPSSGTYSRGNGCTSLAPLGYTSGGCTMLGNPDLKPEVSTNYEIGANYERSGYQFDATFFYNDVKDLMQNSLYGIRNGQWFTIQRNVGKATTSGIETSFAAPISNTVKLNGNLTYIIESKRKDNDEPLMNVPEVTANVGLYWDINEQWNTFTKVQYLGKQAYNKEDSIRFAEAYTTLDVGTTYNVNKNLSLRAGIDNITETIVKTGDDHGDGNPRVFYMGVTSRF